MEKALFPQIDDKMVIRAEDWRRTMSDGKSLMGQADEIRALRVRVAELERKLSRYRVGEVPDENPSEKEMAAERAVQVSSTNPWSCW